MKNTKKDQKTLVVLPYYSGTEKVQGNELLLCLMGWYKYCQFPYHFVVTGSDCHDIISEFPAEDFENIVIPRIDKAGTEEQFFQHLDVMHNWEVIFDKFKKDYSGFIWIADDNYAIHPFDLKDITTVHYLEDDFIGKRNTPCSHWQHDKWKTRALLYHLEQSGINVGHKNYTTHYPCFFKFKELMRLKDEFNMSKESYVVEDLYFNIYRHPEPVHADNIRLGVWNRDIFVRQFPVALANPLIKFVVNSEAGWNEEMEKALLERYLENC